MNPDCLRLAVLQTVRLKGRVSAQAMAESLGIAPADMAIIVQTLLDASLVAEAKGHYKITPPGRDELARRVRDERFTIDQPGLAAAYDAFHAFNMRFKRLVTDWQLRDGTPNPHTDAAYDREVLSRLGELQSSFAPLLQRMVRLAPRLSHYPARLARAASRVGAGDTAWFARPMADSYHTVWFELHEDLIGMLGLSREVEAAGGRAE